jgi:hypothetical protein
MRATVIEAYRSSYRNPIRFAKGDTVRVGHQDAEYPGWVWTTTAEGNSGWAPAQILEVDGDTAIAKEDYSARELDTEPGDELTIHRKIGDWLWVTDSAGELGWVPAKSVKTG